MPDEASEKQRELQEKLKNMSPEELRDFQKQNCIFCQIISGKIQSRKIYEDEKVFAVLDINPANPGHILLLTKEHYSIMPQMPDEIVKYIGIISKQLSRSLIKSMKLDGTTIFIANGVVAGQKAQHFMLHIIPRKENDELGLDIKPKNSISIEDQLKIKPTLHKKFLASMGLPESKEPGYEDDVAPQKEGKEEEVEIQKPKSAMKAESRVSHIEEDHEEENDDDSDLDQVMSALGATMEQEVEEPEPEVEGLEEDDDEDKKAVKEESEEESDEDDSGNYGGDDYNEDDSSEDDDYKEVDDGYQEPKGITKEEEIEHPPIEEPEEQPDDMDEIEDIKKALGEEEKKEDSEKKKKSVNLDDISSLFG